VIPTNHTSDDTFSTSWNDHEGLLPMGFFHDQHERPLRSALSTRRARIDAAEEMASELLSRIQNAESMGRHVPAFLERKLARTRDRLDLLHAQILSLEAQLEGAC
jgi:hypothetical protein